MGDDLQGRESLRTSTSRTEIKELSVLKYFLGIEVIYSWLGLVWNHLNKMTKISQEIHTYLI